MKPIDIVLSKLEALKPTGDSGRQWVGCCPSHPDTIQSLSVGVKDNGNVLMRCFAGCPVPDICASIGIEEKDLFVVREGENPGVTVGTLAFHKRLSPGWLKLCGVRQIPGRNAVEIPYRDANGGELFCRTREHIQAKKGTRQPTGVKLQPYGMWKLDEFRAEGKKTLVLVEGESDCWRLWYHGFPALGIPGSAAVKALHADSLVGFDAVLLWNEPDGGGDSFVKGMTLRLAELGYPGLVKVHKATKDAKDPSDIGAMREATFTAEFQALIDNTPLAGTTELRPETPGGMPACVADAGFTVPPFAWGVHPFTDYGNARRLIALSGQDLLYVDAWERWYVWDGVRWEHDQTRAVERHAVKAIHGVWWEGTEGIAPSRSAADAAEQWWKSSLSAGRIAATVALARSMLPTLWQDFDTHDTLFNAANGTIDLTTGELREANRDDRLTLRSEVRYDPAATCPLWERTLEQIFPVDPTDPDAKPDADTIEYVQRLLGCCITGKSPPILPVFQGKGSNGKSLILAVLTEIIGDDYTVTPSSELLMDGKEQHPTILAQLLGKRAAFVSETEEGRKLRAALAKKLTGGDRIPARRMGEDFWEFDPTHTIILCTNPKPRVDANDPALWRRLALIPFRCVFWNAKKGESGPEYLKADPDLKDRLLAESEGILAWLVTGAKKYLASGMTESDLIREATKEYRQEEDTVEQFLSEHTKTITGCRTEKGKLYEAYKQWSETRSNRPLDAKRFGQVMTAKGYAGTKSGSVRYWDGIDFDDNDQLSKEFD